MRCYSLSPKLCYKGYLGSNIADSLATEGKCNIMSFSPSDGA